MVKTRAFSCGFLHINIIYKEKIYRLFSRFYSCAFVHSRQKRQIVNYLFFACFAKALTALYLNAAKPLITASIREHHNYAQRIITCLQAIITDRMGMSLRSFPFYLAFQGCNGRYKHTAELNTAFLKTIKFRFGYTVCFIQ